MVDVSQIRRETVETASHYWFVLFVEEIDHTDVTLSLRFHIRPGLFIQYFYGQLTGTINFALVENGRRIFGLDKQRGRWHQHPFGNTSAHESIHIDLGQDPLVVFMDKVETLLVQQELL